MGFFKKRRESDENLALLRRLDKRGVSSLTQRDPKTYQERILGRNGAFSVADETLIISCENKVLFRHPLKNIKAGELMNLSGITLNVGEERYVAYYTDGTLGKKK
ncbi:MAG: hypothetical protein IJP27_01860 [Clostridia bacterium]|nr:hypothetical protein [Bacillota bacterium]MBQ6823373.1 hypothetical protein [Clostridia bacterium]